MRGLGSFVRLLVPLFVCVHVSVITCLFASSMFS